MALGDLITQEGQWEIDGVLIGEGTSIALIGVEGLGTPDLRTADLLRGHDHGAFAGVDLYAGRTVRLTMGVDSTTPTGFGVFSPATLAKKFAARSTPVGVAFWPRRAPIKYRFDAFPRRLALTHDEDFALGIPTLVAELWAPDPRIYQRLASDGSHSAALTASTSVTNDGNFETLPTVNVTGPAGPGFSLSCGGKDLTISHSLGSGDVMGIDFRDKTVTVNGVSIYGDVTSTPDQWWSLAPGANTVAYSGGGTTPLIFWRDAFVVPV